MMNHYSTFCITLAAAIAALASPVARATPKESAVWQFGANKAKGAKPLAGVIADSSGDLFGTTTGDKGKYGSVFELVPPGASRRTWQLQVLQEFNERKFGALPFGGLVMDPSGVLYGTNTIAGAYGNGVVFQITPSTPKRSDVTYTVLYNFETEVALTGLLRGSNGHLYGVTTNGNETVPSCTLQCGTVFELVPPKDGKSKWKYNPLYIFQGGNDGISPQAALISDSTGALYGTTYYGGSGGAGTVFKLTPPAKGETAWTESVLYAFQNGTDGGLPLASLTLGKEGVLYGTTTAGGNVGCGVVFTLTPPSDGETAWTESAIYSFIDTDGCGPVSNVTLNPDGSLVGTTPYYNGGYGVVYELTPPSGGQGPWTSTILHQFTDEGEGLVPMAGLLKIGKSYFGTTYEGGRNNTGTVYKLTP
jgi:uncharacterized repeat protein (TIGR03803 family)